MIAGCRHVLVAPPYCGLGVGLYMYIFTMVVAATPVYVFFTYIYINSGADVDRVVARRVEMFSTAPPYCGSGVGNCFAEAIM